MLSIDPITLSPKEHYKFLIGSIIPRPIAFVTTKNDDGIVNAAPFSFFNIVSSNPPTISISVARKAGVKKDTARNILANKEFVVHIVDDSNVIEVNKTAALLAPEESEIPHTSFTLIKSEKVSVPAVAEAKIRFECVLRHSIELEHDGVITNDLLLGEIVQYHIEEQLYTDGKIDFQQLQPVSRLAGNDYALIGKHFSIQRPL